MPRLALVLAALAAGCASPTASGPAGPGPEAPEGEPVEGAPFDAQAWIAAVEAATTDAERVALSTDLFDAVDWRVACGEDDPTAPRRGVVHLHDVEEPGVLAEITCDAAAYQSVFALVDAEAGKPPRLVRSLTVSREGVPGADTTASFFGVLAAEAAPAGHFDVLTKDAGHGGCGRVVRYRLGADGGAEIARVWLHDDCDEPLAPEAWPVTYSDAP